MKTSHKIFSILILLITICGVFLYIQNVSHIQERNTKVIDGNLKGRYVLKGATCAGFEFGDDPATVIWRNEIECSINDIDSSYYDTQALFWLDNKIFIVKDIKRLSPNSPPRVYVYVIKKNDGTNLTLRSLWTGWGEYKFDTLEFVRK